jgi:hypothetical protein
MQRKLDLIDRIAAISQSVCELDCDSTAIKRLRRLFETLIGPEVVAITEGAEAPPKRILERLINKQNNITKANLTNNK